MRTRPWCVAAVLVCSSAPAAAQTVLSEADALARLSPASPRVQAIRAAVELGRADILAAGRWPNPVATVNREAVAGITENMVMVTQALPITGRRQLQMSAASSLLEASSRRADDEVRAVRAALRSAYADLISAQVREAEIERARDHLRELADVLARRESAGEAAGYDRLRSEREVAELDGERSTIRAERARAQAALGAFFADLSDATTLVAVVPERAARVPVPAVDDLMTRAASARGEPAALQHEIDSARFAARAAERRLVPEPEVVAGTKSSTVGGGDIGSVLSVHVTVPLFDRGRPERTLAQARIVQAEARRLAFQTTLRAQVTALRAVVLERREAADRYRDATSGTADQLERIAQVSYEAGERGILELLDAYRNSAAARTRQIVLDTAARQAEIELEFTSGWEIP